MISLLYRSLTIYLLVYLLNIKLAGLINIKLASSCDVNQPVQNFKEIFDLVITQNSNEIIFYIKYLVSVVRQGCFKTLLMIFGLFN